MIQLLYKVRKIIARQKKMKPFFFNHSIFFVVVVAIAIFV